MALLAQDVAGHALRGKGIKNESFDVYRVSHPIEGRDFPAKCYGRRENPLGQ